MRWVGKNFLKVVRAENTSRNNFHIIYLERGSRDRAASIIANQAVFW